MAVLQSMRKLFWESFSAYLYSDYYFLRGDDCELLATTFVEWDGLCPSAHSRSNGHWKVLACGYNH